MHMQGYNESFEMKRRRIRNALWGLFVGDALSMPAHWFYNLKNIDEYFEGGIRGYVPPPHPHPESFMVGMQYHPDVETATRLGRKYDILHEHARYYDTSYGENDFPFAEREGEHGNKVPALKERFHYHHGLKAGENTLGAGLVAPCEQLLRHGDVSRGLVGEDHVDRGAPVVGVDHPLGGHADEGEVVPFEVLDRGGYQWGEPGISTQVVPPGPPSTELGP